MLVCNVAKEMDGLSPDCNRLIARGELKQMSRDGFRCFRGGAWTSRVVNDPFQGLAGSLRRRWVRTLRSS